ncbi:MAG: OmpA family protein [Polyangiales bacterium]
MRRLTQASLSVTSLSLVALATSAAHAQTAVSGFAIDRFEPSERGSEWFVQDSLDFRGHLRPVIGVVADYSHDDLVIYNPNGSQHFAPVEDMLLAHVGASLVLLDRLRFGVNLPVALFMDGDNASLEGYRYSAASGFAIGDLRLSGDVRLLGKYGDAFTAAFGVQVFVPIGSQSNYTSDGSVRIAPRLQVAGDVSMFAYAARVGFDYRSLESTINATSSLGSTFSFGASAGLRLMDRKLLIGPEIWGSTVVVNGNAFNDVTSPLEANLGAHYTFGDWRVGGAWGFGVTRGYGSPQDRLLASLEWAPQAKTAPADRDHDGILDVDDACPDVPGIKSADPTKNGCPDRDHDGIVDKDDACPDVPGLASSDPTKNGCPLADKDNDGIPDDEDACPEEKGVKSSDPKMNGCPPDRDGDGIPDKDDACPDVAGPSNPDKTKDGCPGDRDGDGIRDDKDACPDEKGVASDDPKKHGCNPDRDGDKILNEDDACPDAPGPKSKDPKKNGCPSVAIVGGEIKILQQVKFATDRAEILPESDKILGEVSKILREHPEITKVRIEGHTDNRGGADHNKDLSTRRAASVVKWLTTKGKLDAKRFESEGFGQDRPIDTNDTPEGRQNNRRVEFHIVETSKPGAVKDR